MTYVPKKRNRSANYDGRTADKNIKFCPKCRKCWQTREGFLGSKLVHYDDFVSFGKEKKPCMLCIDNT